MNFLSVCSGIEAASVAAIPLGFTPVGFAEIDKAASRVLAFHHGSNMPGEELSRNGVPNFGDFTQIPLDRLPSQVDWLVGGTPCQAFSVAGKRLSLADARGNLTLAYAVLAHELVRSHGLKGALWENVPGCLSTHDNAFGCFMGGLVGANDALIPCARPPRGRSNAGWKWRKARREPILDGEGNETGEFTERPAEHVVGWPSAGMASGPRARLAWRVLDAQYFGLAQRRERVFVVVGFGNGIDPAAILFERQSLRGNSAPRRETGKSVTGTLSARTEGGGGLGTDFDLDGGLVAAPALARCDATREGSSQDFETTTMVAHALRAEGFDASEDGTGRGTPIVPQLVSTLVSNGDAHSGYRDEHGLVPIAFAIQERAVSENPNAGPNGIGVQEGVAYTLEARQQAQAVAQNTRDEVRLQGGDGQISGALAADPGMKQTTYVAIPEAVAFDLRGREGGSQFEGPHDTANIRAASGGSSRSYVAERWAVRRITPREAERLQGFPDGWTEAPDESGKPQADGPRYKQLGNSMAVNVMSWLFARIKAQAEGRL